jgi:hypothetical protein
MDSQGGKVDFGFGKKPVPRCANVRQYLELKARSVRLNFGSKKLGAAQQGAGYPAAPAARIRFCHAGNKEGETCHAF